MSFARTLILGLLVAAFGAYIYLVEQPKLADEARGDRVLDFKVDEIGALTLTYPDEVVIRAELQVRPDRSAWKLTQPIEVPADQDQVTRLVQAIHDGAVDRRISAGEADSFGGYGLEGSGTRVKIELQTKGGRKLPAIVVGDTTPVGYQAYARVEGESDLLVTPLLFHSGLGKTVFDLRNKKLFDVAAAEAVAITVRRSDADQEPVTMRFARNGQDWRIVEPNERRADPAAVDGLAHAVNQLSAIGFLDAAAAEGKGLDRPWLDVDVELGDGTNVGFVAGDIDEDKAKGYIIRRKSDGQVAKVAEWIKTRYGRDIKALRARNLFDCERGSVVRVNVERADEPPFSIHNKDGRWTVEPNPEGLQVRQEIAAKAIDNLVAFRAKDILDENVTDGELAAVGLSPPDVTLELMNTEGNICGKAIAGVSGISPVETTGQDGEAATNYYFFKRADDDTVFSAPEYLYSRVDMRRTDLLASAPPVD